MPNDNQDATVLAPKQTSYYRFLVVLVPVVLVVVGLGILWQRDGAYLELGGKRFRAEILDTEQTRSQGLSGREGLDADASMLFVFDAPDKRCFWMKDMRFSIDILWFDDARRLIHQEHGVSPETYPESYCVHGAQYVVELPAGVAQSIGVELGEDLTIHNR